MEIGYLPAALFVGAHGGEINDGSGGRVHFGC